MHMYVCIRIANTINFIVIIMIFFIKKIILYSPFKKNNTTVVFYGLLMFLHQSYIFYVHIHMHNDAIYYRKLKSMQFERTSNYLTLKSDYNQIIDPLLIFYCRYTLSEEIPLDVIFWFTLFRTIHLSFLLLSCIFRKICQCNIRIS